MAPATTMWPGKPDVYHSYQALLFPSLPLPPGRGRRAGQPEARRRASWLDLVP